jgi:hypothetical protein
VIAVNVKEMDRGEGRNVEVLHPIPGQLERTKMPEGSLGSKRSEIVVSKIKRL